MGLGEAFAAALSVLLGGIIQAFGFWLTGQAQQKQKDVATAASNDVAAGQAAHTAALGAYTTDPAAYKLLCDRFRW